MRKPSMPILTNTFEVTEEQIDFAILAEYEHEVLNGDVDDQLYAGEAQLTFRARSGVWIWNYCEFSNPQPDISTGNILISAWRLIAHCNEKPTGLSKTEWLPNDFRGDVVSFSSPNHIRDEGESIISIDSDHVFVENYFDAVTARFTHPFRTKITTTADHQHRVYEMTIEGLYPNGSWTKSLNGETELVQ